jgi:hypothetical protein
MHDAEPRVELRRTVERVELVRAFVETSTEGARELGRWYWSELERSTRGLVRGRVSGTEIRLVLGRSLTLLHFGHPELAVDGDDVECRFPILGGLLTSEPGGSLVIAQRDGSRAPRLEIAVCGYQPSLAHRGSRFHRGLLYTALQAPVHRAISRRSLARAARRAR